MPALLWADFDESLAPVAKVPAVEGDVGGGLGAGIDSVLVRTGKYTEAKAAESEVDPTATIDSIAELPALIG